MNIESKRGDYGFGKFGGGERVYWLSTSECAKVPNGSLSAERRLAGEHSQGGGRLDVLILRSKLAPCVEGLSVTFRFGAILLFYYTAGKIVDAA